MKEFPSARTWPYILFAGMLLGCQKKEEAVRNSEQAPAMSVVKPESAPDPFDTSKTLGAADINGDGAPDSIKVVHVGAAGSIAKRFTIIIPDRANGAKADSLAGWGLELLLGRPSGATKKEDSIFIPEIGAVIYDQDRSVEILPMDSVIAENPEMKSSVGEGVDHVISLFTQSGQSVYLHWTGKGFGIYWPPDEPQGD